jgi:hypothetical protein
VIGRDIKVGNIIVENISDRRIEVITQYYEEIPIDDKLRTFYNEDIDNGLAGLPDFKPQSKDPKKYSWGGRNEVKPLLLDDIGDAQNTKSATAAANALLIYTTAYNKCDPETGQYSSSVPEYSGELKDDHVGAQNGNISK